MTVRMAATASLATSAARSSAEPLPTESHAVARNSDTAPRTGRGKMARMTSPRRQLADMAMQMAVTMAAEPSSALPNASPTLPLTSDASEERRVVTRPTLLRGSS